MISILQLQASKHREQTCISEEEVQTSSPAHTDITITVLSYLYLNFFSRRGLDCASVESLPPTQNKITIL